METEKIVLDVLEKAGKPLSAGQISEITAIDRKLIDKAMKTLKNQGKIESPKVCFWQPKK